MSSQSTSNSKFNSSQRSYPYPYHSNHTHTHTIRLASPSPLHTHTHTPTTGPIRSDGPLAAAGPLTVDEFDPVVSRVNRSPIPDLPQRQCDVDRQIVSQLPLNLQLPSEVESLIRDYCHEIDPDPIRRQEELNRLQQLIRYRLTGRNTSDSNSTSTPESNDTHTSTQGQRSHDANR